MSATRPNFVIVMAEHIGAGHCPGYGPTPIDGPHLERLAAESICFEQAHCAAPVCGPSRAAFLTGCYACNIPVWDNGSTIPPWVPTYAHLLTAAGYETVMNGRMHIHGLDQNKGFEQRPNAEIIDPRVCTRADWPGSLEPLGPPVATGAVTQVCPVSDSPLYRHDTCVTDTACEYLRQRDANERPFMMTVGYLGAHPGSNGNPDLAPLYADYLQRDFPIAPLTSADYARLPEHTRRQLAYSGTGDLIFDREWYRHELAMHYSRVTDVDRQLGRVYEALRNSAVADSTYLIFLSDHGDNVGAHGLFGKMNFYDGAQRVPLMVRPPGGCPGGKWAPGRTSLIDVLPTLAELAGVDVPFPIDGVSFAGALAGDPTSPRPADGTLFSEYHGYLAPSSMYMLLQGRLKYNCYLAEADELFDLAADPGELHNLLDDPANESMCLAHREALREIIDVDAAERAISRHNERRQAVFDGLSASAAIEAEARAFIAHFRQQHPDAWWDGGAYMAREKAQFEAKQRGKR